MVRPGSILGPQQQYLMNMDKRLMETGGQLKRDQLIKAFGEESIRAPDYRELTTTEKRIAQKGDAEQAEKLRESKFFDHFHKNRKKYEEMD